MYSRQKGVPDTSAFEHIFVGEMLLKDNEVGGMHNWLRFYQLEQMGAVDYSGYVIKRGNTIANIRFKWNNTWKSTGGFMIGTSPEFDFSVYTLCYLAKPGFRSCNFELNNCNVQITSHSLQQNGQTFIGTAFPSPGRTSVGCR